MCPFLFSGLKFTLHPIIKDKDNHRLHSKSADKQSHLHIILRLWTWFMKGKRGEDYGFRVTQKIIIYKQAQRTSGNTFAAKFLGKCTISEIKIPAAFWSLFRANERVRSAGRIQLPTATSPGPVNDVLLIHHKHAWKTPFLSLGCEINDSIQNNELR